MKIYLVQHGKPVPKDVNSDRPLADEGKRDIGLIADLLMGHGVEVENIYHSGKTRAKQTAEILAHFVLNTGEPQLMEGLAPMDDISLFMQRIETLEDDSLFVGHLPHLGKVVSSLVCGEPVREIVTFQQGSIVCLEPSEHGNWSISWMVVPWLL